MDKRKQTLEQIESSKVVAVVRLDHASELEPTVQALLDGGVRLVEATMTIPGLLEAVPGLVERFAGRMVFGIGSVLDGETAVKAARAGADFVVSPVMKPEILNRAHEAGCAAAVGAYSPTEIQRAWEAGSDIVKVFPAETLGPRYIKGVRAPMPHLKLMPTGGVSADNVGQWLAAGSVALGVGSALVDVKAVRQGRFDVIRDNAAALRQAVDAYLASAG